MINIIIRTLLGIILILGGIYLFYLYMNGLESGSNLLLLGLAILCLIFGGGLLFLASRTEMKNDSGVNADNAIPPSTGLAETLKRNNEIAVQWDKTQKERDKLKMLEIASSAASDPKA